MSELTDVTRLKEGGYNGENVIRFIDKEAGVVIYYPSGNSDNGMTSISITKTDL